MKRPNRTGLWSLLTLALVAVSPENVRADDSGPASWPAETCPIQAGETLPSTLVTAADGSSVDLAESVTEKPTLLVFFRGGW